MFFPNWSENGTPGCGGEPQRQSLDGRRRIGFVVALSGATMWLKDCRVSISLAPTQPTGGAIYTGGSP